MSVAYMRKLLLALFVLATSALAADVTGTWRGTAGADAQSHAVIMVFKQAGSDLTGTAGYTADEQVPFSNGKISGEKISFDIVTDADSYKIELSPDGDGLKGTVEVHHGDQKVVLPLTLKKATS